MTWHYRCPNCGRDIGVDWDDHTTEMTCPFCNHDHYPPTPGEDHLAYFAAEKWSRELEDAVIALRGTTCEVPGCYREYETLVPSKPVARGGHTSVENMLPMCNHHARLKGDQEYNEWIRSLPPEETAPPAEFEITFTEASASPAAPPQPPPVMPPAPAGIVVPIAGRATVPDNHPPGMHMVTSAPFLAGPVRRLVLHYDWVVEHEGSGSVILLAWPGSEPPDLEHGTDGLSVPKAFNEHSGKAGTNGSARLELPLPPDSDGLWVGAVLLKSTGGRPVLRDYFLAGTD
jgi:hypothetical protein